LFTGLRYSGGGPTDNYAERPFLPDDKQTDVDHPLTGKTPSGETLNRWTWNGMTSDSTQWTEMTRKNGLPDIL